MIILTSKTTTRASKNMAFQKATREQAKLRAIFEGPSGSGKSYSALKVGRALVGPTGRIALIDTEKESCKKYAGDKECAGDFDFASIDKDYTPSRLITLLKEVVKEGYDLVIVDSLTHFWTGPGGFLEINDNTVKAQKARGWSGDSFGAWKETTKLYNRWIQDILDCNVHFIGTLRAKADYEKTTNDKGKAEVKKVGMAPEMRAGFEYEFDLEGMMTMENTLLVGKTRCNALKRGIFEEPGENLAKPLREWLSTGAPKAAIETPTEPAPAPEPAAEKQEFLTRVSMVATKSELDVIRAEVQVAKKDGLISDADYKEIGKAYTEAKGKVAAA